MNDVQADAEKNDRSAFRSGYRSPPEWSLLFPGAMMRLPFLIAVGIIIAATTGGGTGCRGEEIKGGQVAYDEHDYQTAYADLKPFTGWDDPGSQLLLATMLYCWHGTSENDPAAFHLALKLAQAGSLPAAAMVGKICATGAGTPQSATKSVYWSAAGGDASSQTRLGELYETGNGVPRDYDRAVMWYKKAAAKGDPDAMYALGAMYMNGQAPRLNIDEATDYLSRSAQTGNPAALYTLGMIWEGKPSADGSRQPIDMALGYALLDLARAYGEDDAQNMMANIEGHYPLELVNMALDMAASWKIGTALPASSLDDSGRRSMPRTSSTRRSSFPSIRRR